MRYHKLKQFTYLGAEGRFSGGSTETSTLSWGLRWGLEGSEGVGKGGLQGPLSQEAARHFIPPLRHAVLRRAMPCRAQNGCGTLLRHAVLRYARDGPCHPLHRTVMSRRAQRAQRGHRSTLRP